MAHSKIRTYDITVVYGGDNYKRMYGYCTIIRDKGTKTVEIQMDKELLNELNPDKAPMYTTENQLYTYIPYEGTDFKFDSIRKYVKMWLSVHMYAIQNKINPKDLCSLVLYSCNHKDFSPEVTIKKWETAEKRSIGTSTITLQLVGKAQEFESYNRIHDWIKDETHTYVSVQMPDCY